MYLQSLNFTIWPFRKCLLTAVPDPQIFVKKSKKKQIPQQIYFEMIANGKYSYNKHCADL